MLGVVRSGFSAVGKALMPPSLHKLLEGAVCTSKDSCKMHETAESHCIAQRQPPAEVRGATALLRRVDAGGLVAPCNEAQPHLTAGGTDAGSEVSDGSVTGGPESDALRRDLLTGHLLALATGDGLPRHALPALAGDLQVFTCFHIPETLGNAMPTLSLHACGSHEVEDQTLGMPACACLWALRAGGKRQLSPALLLCVAAQGAAAEVGAVGADAAACAVRSRLPPPVCQGTMFCARPLLSLCLSPVSSACKMALRGHLLMQDAPTFPRTIHALKPGPQEVGAAGEAAAMPTDPLSAWALERFWRPASGAQAHFSFKLATLGCTVSLIASLTA